MSKNKTKYFKHIDIEDQISVLSTVVKTDREETRSDSGYYEPYQERPFNPDPIYKKRGNLTIYDEMRRDDQVKAVLQLKKFMVLSTGWTIEAAKDENQDEAVEFLTANLESLNIPDFNTALFDILTYLDYGYSVTEPVFKVSKENKIILHKLKTRAPHTFEFHTDDFGDIEFIKQFTNKKDLFIDPKKVLHLKYQSNFGNPYGTSDLQAAYRAYFSKDIVIRFWTIFLERFGNPHVIAKLPTNLMKQYKDEVLEIIKNLQVKTGILIPDSAIFELLFPPSGNTDFERAIDKFNMMIARSLLVPDLVGVGGSEITGGSFALGKKQFQIFFKTIDRIRDDIEKIVNRQLTIPLCFFNFGLKEKYPLWKLNPISDDNKIELLKLWVAAAKGKVWKASDDEINHFRQETGFPQDDEIERAAERQPPQPGEKEEPQEDEGAEGGQDNPEKKKDKFARTQLARERTIYEERIDFDRIDNELTELNEKSYSVLAPIFDKIKNSIIEIASFKINLNTERINKIEAKHLKELQRGIKTMLDSTYKAGEASARREIDIKKKSENMAFIQPIDFKKSIEERSFFITGIESEHILKKVKLILLDGIDKGLSTDEIVFKLEEFFDADYDWIKQPGADIVGHRLETITRTNINKAYNFGRRRFFESPALADFVTGYQFSAILDARTTPICTSLDGKTYKINDPYINVVTAPLHFRCRSLWIPITINEPFNPSDKVDLGKFPEAF